MAYLSCDFSSEKLQMVTSMRVVLPESVDLNKVKVIYLLHGLMDNCSGWTRYTSVERYARQYNAAIVMPEVQRSFYTDMEMGLDYFSYVSQELPQVCEGFFGLSRRREQNYIMGLSMGGYGALKCAFTNPQNYAGVASFSAVTDIVSRIKDPENQMQREFPAIFGGELAVPDDCNLVKLAEKIDAESFPKIMCFCGEQDKLYVQNVRFVEKLHAQGVDAKFLHWSGAHEWSFWDAAVHKAIDAMLGEMEVVPE